MIWQIAVVGVGYFFHILVYTKAAFHMSNQFLELNFICNHIKIWQSPSKYFFQFLNTF